MDNFSHYELACIIFKVYKVQLTVTLHRNRLNVKTVNNILMVGTNTNSVKDLDVDECVKIFLQKKRRICQN